MLTIILCLSFILSVNTSNNCYKGGALGQDPSKCLLPLFHGTFQQAVTLCKVYDARLPIIHLELYNFMFSYFQINSCGTNESSLWLGIDPQGWNDTDGHWVDGTEVDWNNWKSPEDEEKHECVVIDRYDNVTWKSRSCEEKAMIVCVYDADESSSYCASFDLQFAGGQPTCLFFQQSAYQWAANYEVCHSKTSEPLYIHSKEQNELAIQYFLSSIDTHGAIVDLSRRARIWLGLMVGSETWTDGSPVDYDNFAPGEQTEENMSKCVQMAMTSVDDDVRGLWYASDCEEPSLIQATICSRKAFTSIT